MAPGNPLATYRLQLSKDFGFDDAARIVPYLKSLGISHLYTSPFLKARVGSKHGYDVIDHRELNPELGGEAGFARLTAALKEAGLGLILDFVPNHVAVGYADNPWWLEVLEWGQKAPRAASFDINWEMLPHRRGGGVLLPVLGSPYGEALTLGDIKLKYNPAEGSFSAWYFEHRFPINPQRYGDILKTVVTAAAAATEPAGRELLAIASKYGRPGAPSFAQAAALKQELAGLAGATPIIERGLCAYRTDDEAGVKLLHRLLERQHYRLAYWRLAISDINYRRFFDINELAGLRVEHARTFRDIHELVERLIGKDELQGLRLDHIDGLLDPQQYIRRLQQLVRRARGDDGPFYIVLEKILADGEVMPPFPGVAGTTGYESLNVISRVLVRPAGQARLAAIWRSIDSAHAQFATVLETAKGCVLETIMASEFGVLVQLLIRIAAGHYSTRDYSIDRLRTALRLYVLEFPIYRTYVTARGCTESDRTVIERTIAAARKRWQGIDVGMFDFLRDALTLDLVQEGGGYSKRRVQQFALKMQQFTGPMMAKSLEDTALYRYHALLGLNEVGGDPSLPPLPIPEFHAHMARRARHFRHGLTATATHDTKRGEDARTRILALSECPQLWEQHVAAWREMNARYVHSWSGRQSPMPGHEYMLYQALVGTWPHEPLDPTFTQRIEAYAIKAAREGKVETNWLNPDERYEEGLVSFIRAILDSGQAAEFLESLDALARRAALLGALNSSSQLVLKSTIPGVPDVYQGTEWWDLSLVDPDNRRPVDYDSRREALSAVTCSDWPELVGRWPDGRIKLALMRRLLSLRSQSPVLFHDGDYEPIQIDGRERDHVIAYMRSCGRDGVLVAAGRHFASATSQGLHWPRVTWEAELKLPQNYRISGDALGVHEGLGQSLAISNLFAVLPVAVLRTRRAD